MKKDFLWGGALSNVQAEGGYLEDGKGLNVYDNLTVTPEKGIEPQFCKTNIAVDHYHHWQEDIDLMAEMGFKAYRFSIVWSRINPLGDEEEPNEKGLAFYERMVDYCLSKNIEPIVSLVHFDMPLHLMEEYNGFLNKKVIEFYVSHVRHIVNRLKGKVKYYITYNEINLGVFMPELVAGVRLAENMSQEQLFAQLTINLQIAHAKAVLAIKNIDPEAQVGGMIGHTPFYAATCKPEDVLANQFQNQMHNYLALDIMCFGRLPHYFLQFMKNRNINVEYSESEKENIYNASRLLDYIAFSYYQSAITTSFNDIQDISKEEDAILYDERGYKNPYCPANEWGWQIDANGLRYSLIDFYSRYHKPLFIVENGIGIDEKLINGKVYDDERIIYYQKHITAMKEAIEHDGVNVIGYLAWGPIDFLSSHKEIRKRYGFVYVNRDYEEIKDLKRYRKKSFYWYQKVIHSNGTYLENNIDY